MGFANPVLGGAEKLIRKAIQSPNYIAGLLGWSINKDGSAEFNSITIRGTVIVFGTRAVFVYSATPAAGNLVCAIASADGADAFGNNYYSGITLYAVDPTHGGRITFGNKGSVIHYNATPTPTYTTEVFDDGVNQSTLFVQTHGAGGATDTTQSIAGDDGVTYRVGNEYLVKTAANVHMLSLTAAGMAVGTKGYRGMQSETDATFTQLAVVSAVITQITTKVDVDYQSNYSAGGGEWAGTATYTAPVDGFYDTTLFLVNPLAAANFTRAIIRKNGANIAANNGVNGGDCVAGYEGVKLLAGDTLTFHVRHNAGVNTDLSGRISVHRRLV